MDEQDMIESSIKSIKSIHLKAHLFIAREEAPRIEKNNIQDSFGELLYIRSYMYNQPSNMTAQISFLKGTKTTPFFRLGKTISQ